MTLLEFIKFPKAPSKDKLSASRIVIQFVILLMVVLALTWLCRWVITTQFEHPLKQQYWTRDFYANLLVSIVITLLTKTFAKAVLVSSLFIVMFQMGNAAKLSILGTPASPDDFFNIQNIFFLADGWQRWALIGIAGLPFVLLLLFFAYEKARFWITAGLLILTSWGIDSNSERLLHHLDSKFGNSVWNQPANYHNRGLGLHLAQEIVRTLSKVGESPGDVMVEQALQSQQVLSPSAVPLEPTLQQQVPTPDSAAAPRNVHVFVLESFFDPVSLGSDWVPQDPLPADFRKLWQTAGNSMALSPVFGGYTANAEFEVLCGFPVTRNAVFFEGWLRRKAPCLPQVLADSGYDTVTSHPNVPGFWNRTHAYNLIGFDQYLSISSFDMSDSVNTLLMDHSLYDQVFAKLEARSSTAAVFNYMLTYYGHLPYPSSERYPDRVRAGKESALLHGYLNQLWYKSRALMSRLSMLREQDPNALIVIFGDHLPFLGQNYGVYTEAWNLPQEREDYTGEQLERLVSTPLIVIDGQNGPLSLGKLPIYRLPALITSLLGMAKESHIFNHSRNPNDVWIRPVYGMHINVTDAESVACTNPELPEDGCLTTQTWFENIELLTADIFTGEQYSLKNLPD